MKKVFLILLVLASLFLLGCIYLNQPVTDGQLTAIGQPTIGGDAPPAEQPQEQPPLPVIQDDVFETTPDALGCCILSRENGINDCVKSITGAECGKQRKDGNYSLGILSTGTITDCSDRYSCQTSETPLITISAITFPEQAAEPLTIVAGEETTIYWQIKSMPALISHTAVHYGPESKPEAKLPSDYPNASEIQCQETACSIPEAFKTTLVFNEPGTYYYRAHAIIDSNHYWSIERSFIVEAAATETPAEPQTFEVSIQNYAFSPAELSIKKGDTVKWTNLDGVQHSATSDTQGVFNSGLLGQNQSFSFTFNEAGTFSYYCMPHPYMKAKIIVE